MELSDEESRGVGAKHFFGKNGHTFRTKHFVDGKKGKTLEKNSKRGSRSTDPVPITAVDEFFDWGFVSGTQNYFRSSMRPVREQMEGDDIIECLEANAVRKIEEYRRYEAEMLVHYELPIIGHRLTDLGRALDSQQAHISCSGKKARVIVKDNSNNAKWLFYNGKFWDPNYIYLIHEDYTSEYRVILKPVCALFQSQLQREQVRLGRITPFLYRLAVADFTFSSVDRNNNRHRYLEMDLDEPCMLSHIGIRAIDPGWKHLSHFPKFSREQTEANEMEEAFAKRLQACYRPYRRRGRRFKRHLYVTVIRDYALGWVEMYEVHYRDLQTGKWVNLQRSFEGNSNMADEQISEVEILTRQIRVYPKEWHQHCRFQILVYGRGMESSRGDVTNEAQDQVETVRYTVKPNHDHRKRPDGAISGYRDKWGESKEKAACRRYFQSTIKEDAMFCYDDVSNGEVLRLPDFESDNDDYEGDDDEDS